MIFSLYKSARRFLAKRAIKKAVSEGITEEVVALSRINPGEGVALSDSQKLELKNLCDCSANSDVNEHLNQFANLAGHLYQLDNELQAGELMCLDNRDAILDFKAACDEFIHSQELHKHFCAYFSKAFLAISSETHLSTAIKRFDHTLFLVEMLPGMLESDGIDEFLKEGIDDYEGFKAWEEIIVLQAYAQELDELNNEKLAA